MKIGNNAPNGGTSQELASVLQAGTEAALRVINAGRPADPHTPQANVGVPNGPIKP